MYVVDRETKERAVNKSFNIYITLVFLVILFAVIGQWFTVLKGVSTVLSMSVFIFGKVRETLIVDYFMIVRKNHDKVFINRWKLIILSATNIPLALNIGQLLIKHGIIWQFVLGSFILSILSLFKNSIYIILNKTTIAMDSYDDIPKLGDTVIKTVYSGYTDDVMVRDTPLLNSLLGYEWFKEENFDWNYTIELRSTPNNFLYCLIIYRKRERSPMNFTSKEMESLFDNAADIEYKYPLYMIEKSEMSNADDSYLLTSIPNEFMIQTDEIERIIFNETKKSISKYFNIKK